MYLVQAQTFGIPLPSNLDWLFRRALLLYLPEKVPNVFFQNNELEPLSQVKNIEDIDLQFLNSLANQYSIIVQRQPAYPDSYLILSIALVLLGRWKETIPFCARG